MNSTSLPENPEDLAYFVTFQVPVQDRVWMPSARPEAPGGEAGPRPVAAQCHWALALLSYSEPEMTVTPLGREAAVSPELLAEGGLSA